MPIIGISGSIFVEQDGIFPGYKRAYVNDDYIGSVIQAGGTPFILPFISDEAHIEKQIEMIDALILSGGHDVTPQLYGQEPKQRLGDTNPERDAYDFKLIELAEKKGIPILGICRGFQILNVYHGGSLLQDLSYADHELLKHSQGFRSDLPTHTITVEESSKLFALAGQSKVMVNSFHHQAVDRLATVLKPVAHATDGIVEAFEHQSYSWEIGVQFHPEMMHREHQFAKNIFAAFIEEAQK